MKIQSGDVFAFIVEQNNQYGIIQVLENGKIGGYNVRIFYYLLGNIDDKAIETTIQSAAYYYINNFHPSALVRNGKRLGRFAIPEVVIPPRYMRECEQKPNGDLHWYVMEDMRVVKTLKKFDEGLKSLSPAAAWGIQYIKKRWLDGFTLDNWHELEEKWYADYLKTYEPDKFLAKEKVPPFEQWAKSGRIPQKPLQEIDLLFKTFILQVSAQKNDETAVHGIPWILHFPRHRVLFPSDSALSAESIGMHTSKLAGSYHLNQIFCLFLLHPKCVDCFKTLGSR